MGLQGAQREQAVIRADHSIFLRPTSCLRIPGTSFRKKRFRAWRISRSTPRPAGRMMRRIARRDICSIPMLLPPETTSMVSRAAPKNSRRSGANEERDLLPTRTSGRESLRVFLNLPQGNLGVHSFCTSAKGFAVATRHDLPQSEFTENVGPREARRTMIAAKLAAKPVILEGELPGETEGA
jgi:hypothetical protein